MAKHRRWEEEDGTVNWPEEDPDERSKVRPQIAEKAPTGEGIGDSSLSPIETW